MCFWCCCWLGVVVGVGAVGSSVGSYASFGFFETLFSSALSSFGSALASFGSAVGWSCSRRAGGAHLLGSLKSRLAPLPGECSMVRLVCDLCTLLWEHPMLKTSEYVREQKTTHVAQQFSPGLSFLWRFGCCFHRRFLYSTPMSSAGLFTNTSYSPFRGWLILVQTESTCRKN